MLLTALAMPMGSTAQPVKDIGRGNSAAVKLCQKDGWTELARAEDRTVAFTYEDVCVSYGAQGGTIMPYQPVPLATLTTTVILVKSPTRVIATITGAGLSPGSRVEHEMYYGGYYLTPRTAATDGSFSATYVFEGWSCGTEYSLRGVAMDGSYVYGIFLFPCPGA
jgi:hypothetical protein